MKSAKILTGKKELASFLDLSEPTIDNLISFGMPVGMINGRIFAHIENIENWFKLLTMRKTLSMDNGNVKIKPMSSPIEGQI